MLDCTAAPACTPAGVAAAASACPHLETLRCAFGRHLTTLELDTLTDQVPEDRGFECPTEDLFALPALLSLPPPAASAHRATAVWAAAGAMHAHPRSAHVQLQGARVLSSLLLASGAYQPTAVSAGACEALASALALHSRNAQRYPGGLGEPLLAALLQAAERCVAGCRQAQLRFAAASGAEAAAAALRCFPGDLFGVALHSAGLFCALCEADDAQFRRDALDAAAEGGALGPLAEALLLVSGHGGSGGASSSSAGAAAAAPGPCLGLHCRLATQVLRLAALCGAAGPEPAAAAGRAGLVDAAVAAVWSRRWGPGELGEAVRRAAADALDALRAGHGANGRVEAAALAAWAPRGREEEELALVAAAGDCAIREGAAAAAASGSGIGGGGGASVAESFFFVRPEWPRGADAAREMSRLAEAADAARRSGDAAGVAKAKAR